MPSKKSRAFIDKDLHHLTAEVGGYVLAQAGFGRFVYSVQEKSAEAAEFFKPILELFTNKP